MSSAGANAKESYHHGDLRAALLDVAMSMLERGEPFSLRAIAREAGVSPAAPYRHFADKDALESALAVEGLRDLKAELMAGRDLPTTLTEVAEFGVAYVEFALRRPALFRLMFGNPCDDQNDQRVRAAADIHDLLGLGVRAVFPDADADALATACWALVHGLACLHLDGKLASDPLSDVSDRARRSLLAIFTATARASEPQ